MPFFLPAGYEARVEVPEYVDRGGDGVGRDDGAQLFPILFPVFVVLWSLVWRICSYDGCVLSPGRDLKLYVSAVMRDNCCYVWPKMWCYDYPHPRTFRFGRAEVEGVLVNAVCGGLLEVCFRKEQYV